MTLLDATGPLAHGFSDARVSELRARIEAVHREMVLDPAPIGLVPLHIACYGSDCANGLHCLDYIRTGRAGTVPGRRATPGECRACATAVASLPVAAARTLPEVAALFDQQRLELIREHYWAAPMDRWAWNQAYRAGRLELHQRARKLVRERVGDARHPREGQQTAWHEDVIAYGQHAVAACCRQCVEYWHGIERGRPMTEREVAYLTGLVTLHLDLRFPTLPDEPSSPPRILKRDIPESRDPSNLRTELSLLLNSGTSPAGLLVPRDRFHSLKTNPAVNGRGGSIQMRPDNTQMTIIDIANADESL